VWRTEETVLVLQEGAGPVHEFKQESGGGGKHAQKGIKIPDGSGEHNNKKGGLGEQGEGSWSPREGLGPLWKNATEKAEFTNSEKKA